MARQNLLLVDDDAKSLRVIEVSLRNAGYAVTTAANGAEALAKMSAARPALVLSDTQMPVLDGYELCKRLKADAQYKEIPFLFLTEEDSVEAKVKGLELGAEDYLAKPIYIKEVITRVRMVLQKQERESLERKDKRRFFGSLEDMGVVDLLQTVEMGQKSGTIRFESDNRRATLWFDQGRVIDAKAGRLGGEDAVYRLLTWETGSFEIDFRAPEVPERITSSTQALLMEGMRRVDEWGRTCEQLPDLDTVFEVDYAELAERLAELPDEVNSLLRLFDGHRTALQAIDDSALADLDALGAISRLYFEGIIFESSVRPPEPAPATSPPRRTGAPLEDWLSEAAKLEDEPPAERSPPPEPVGALPAEPTGGRGIGPGKVEVGRERNLVDDLLASATDIPDLQVEEQTGAFAMPAGATPADEVPFEPPALDDFEDDLRVDDFALGDGDEGDGALPAPEALPGGALGDLDHEHAFFEGPTHAEEADDMLQEEGGNDSLAVYITLAVIAVLALGGMSYFVLRDSVEPHEPGKEALHGGWHRKELKSRKPLGTQAPLDIGWEIPSEPDSGVARRSEQGAIIDAMVPDAAPPSVEAVPEGPSDPAQVESFEGNMKAGLALYDKQQFDRARQKFEAALAAAPADARALLAYSKTLLELGRIKEALTAAEKVIRIKPNEAQPYLIKGTVLQEQGQKEAAIDAYERYLILAGPKARYRDDVRKVLENLK